MTLSVEWVPREENAFADELSKLLIMDDWKSAPKFFKLLEARWGLNSMDLFASSDNAQCDKFYSLHWCRGIAGVNGSRRIVVLMCLTRPLAGCGGL